MDDDLDAFAEVACRPLLEEWSLRSPSPPPLRDATDIAQGESAFELDSVALQFAAGITDGDALAIGHTAPRRPQGLLQCTLIGSAGCDAAAEAGPAVEALPGWRCLQSQHPVNCIRCTPPPPVEQAASWMLVGEKPGKSGERKIRSLLSSSPEWTCDRLRVKLAEELTHAGQFAFAAALRTRDSSTLRKAHLLTLCAHWRYKCDAWVPRCKAEPSKRRRTAPPSLPLPPPVPPPESRVLALRWVLRHRVALYSAATDPSNVHAAAVAEPHAPVLTWNVPMFDGLLPALSGFAAVTTADAALLAARMAAGEAEEPHAGEPSRLLDDAALLSRVDAHVQCFRVMVASSGAGLRSLRAHAPSAPDAAVAASLTASVSQLALLADTCGAALASSRMQRSSAAYLETAAEVVDALAAAMQHMLQVAVARRAWCIARDYTRAPPPRLPAGQGTTVDGTFWPAFLSTLAHIEPTARCAGMDVDRDFAKLGLEQQKQC